MSTSEVIVTEIDTAMSEALRDIAARLQAAMSNPDQISDLALQDMLCSAVKFYARKAEMGLTTPFPPRGGGDLTVNDVMLATSDMLHAMNVQMFELSMWQALTGNSTAPQHRTQQID
jgi:hypothetical protein